MSSVFSLENLTVHHGKLRAVAGVSLTLPRGTALALLGANGAGKSTLIGALLGLYPADKDATGRVFDSPLGVLPAELFRRIGFVADGRTPPGHWTVARLVDYLRPFYPTWDDAYCARLIAKFALPTDRPIAQFSRGMKMKASMVAALSFRPELLVLDEPFGGLDPLTREEFIDGLLEMMEGGEWSILLSSHDIMEVERLCDSVAILDRGRLTLHEDLETLQARFRQWIWRSDAPASTRGPAGWLGVKRDGDRWTGIQPDYAGDAATTETLARAFPDCADLRGEALDLRAILIAQLRAGETRAGV